MSEPSTALIKTSRHQVDPEAVWSQQELRSES